ncbi:MAG: 4-carboxymuconolactone decarboxylase [Novosphingobium sp.]|nr:4-carboxymuconolactone decarboxylase [Novosphingobium sp.]
MQLSLSILPRAVRAFVLALPAVLLPVAARAGPPFLTDDPGPTDTGHWEIYAPMLDGEGRGGAFDGAFGAELNYGAAPGLQLTVGLPVDFTAAGGHVQAGAGDLEVSAKYRFYHDEVAGLSIAVFPGITLPTATHGFGAGRVTALLPIWAQKDIGHWSVFGGGGYNINPGAGNLNYWQGGVAVSRQVNRRLLIGIEADRQGADVEGGPASTRLGVEMIYQLKAPFRLLGSAGPTFEDRSGLVGYHLFMALGLDF